MGLSARRSCIVALWVVIYRVLKGCCKRDFLPQYSVCVSARFPLSLCPSSHRAPPPGEIIGRNVGFIWQETVGDKTGIRWSHPGQLSPVHNFFPQLKKFSVASLMLIQMEPAEGGGSGIQWSCSVDLCFLKPNPKNITGQLTPCWFLFF